VELLGQLYLSTRQQHQLQLVLWYKLTDAIIRGHTEEQQEGEARPIAAAAVAGAAQQWLYAAQQR
jgi:hypothetical protein